jgi:hypothetical protein
MKRILPLAILPLVVALGACSSGSNSQARGGGASDASNGDGGAGDDASGGGDDGSIAPTEYDANLTGGQVTPAAVLTSATGKAKFLLQPDMVTLAYDITQSVANATGVNIHIGAAGENGTVTHPLTPVSGHMTGTITLTSDEQNALALDQLYVEVQSGQNQSGEIRGQLVPPGAEIFVANATGAQQVPPVTSAYTAHGAFVMTWDSTSGMGTLVYHVATSAVPTDVRLHRAIGALNGPVAYDLQPTGAVMDGSQGITGSDNTDVESGHFYLNIVTAANQAGELRGQVIPPGATLFTGVLSGANEVPPVGSQATGGSQFVLSADQTQLSYEAVVSGIIPTGAEIDSAPRGANGPTLYQLTLAQQGALGSTPVTGSDVDKMVGGNLYVNIRDASYSSGELRGQLARQ